MIIIPSVSIGNVPQLAIDLIIHSYGFACVESLDDEFLAPFIGPMDHTSGAPAPEGIATAAQLFRLGQDHIVQLRSPPLTGFKQRFLQSLAQRLQKDELKDSKLMFIGSANAGMSESDSASTIVEQRSSEAQDYPESGFLKEATNLFPGSEMVVMWVHEGDNFSDAQKLAKELVRILHLEPKEFKTPVSWTAVYGRNMPLGIEEGLYT